MSKFRILRKQPHGGLYLSIRAAQEDIPWEADARTWGKFLERVDADVTALVAERLGKRQRILQEFLETLYTLGEFPWGGRIAYPIALMAEDLLCNPRTARGIVKQLQGLSELVTVHWVRRGELDCNDRPSVRDHYEFSMGPVLRAHALEVLGPVHPLLSARFLRAV